MLVSENGWRLGILSSGHLISLHSTNPDKPT
jgi:hypothetical protein